MVGLLRARDRLVGDLHHHVRGARLLQLVNYVTTGFAQTTYYEVAFQFRNVLFHPAPPEQLTQLAFDQKSGQDRKDVHCYACTCQYDKNIKYAKRGTPRGVDDFSIT